MKKIIITAGLILTIPFLLKAQYTGGIGNGDASAGVSNVPLPVQKISVELPAEYELCQNYPNPFNSMTNVKWQMLNAGAVKIIVYDLLGKEVATLVNEELQTGVYQVRFDAENLTSGVYYYRLETNKFSETKKMTILK
ncbi:MAG: T9SS type A sorting domain-containing protein [Ignavibacteria bacterium]|nr:T9SS type A sorting domain-containing protein [Ignavibacteria bacterium]